MAMAPYQHKMELDSIFIKRDERQRKKLTDIGPLADSIARHGLLNPIVVRRDTKTLIAGERRLTAYKALRDRWTSDEPNPYKSIPFRYFDTLDETEAQIVELEENLRRVELSWQELVEAAATIHDLFSQTNPDQTLAQTALHIGVEASTLSRYLQLATEIRKGNTLVLECATMSEAYNKVKRGLERAAGEAMNTLLGGTMAAQAQMAAAFAQSEQAKPEGEGEQPSPPPKALAAMGTILPSQRLVPSLDAGGAPTIKTENVPDAPLVTVPFLNVDFHTWAKDYDGEPFNLIHCDFPYGINHQRSAQGRVEEYGAYADGEDVYWALLDTLATYKSKLLFPSAHIIFWYSMNHHCKTLEFFERHMPEFTFDPFPLVWWKDRSIAPDVDRRPRRVYETALFGFSAERRVVNTRGNLCQAGGGSKTHASEKPAEMIRTFFRMVVDQHTKMLDPTCGSGSAVRAAKSLGATTVLGLERDPQFFAGAVQRWQMAQLTGFNIQDKEDQE